MLREELIDTLRREMRTLATKFEVDDWDNAVSAAIRDTGFSLPTSDSFQIQWLIERSKRALFFTLLSESAHKFKFKQINLNQRFEHYRTLIKDMDKDFYRAIESYPHKFAQVNISHMFGTKIDAGFAYDDMGRERTYDKETDVIFGPTASD